jgi:hypothetical protein
MTNNRIILRDLTDDELNNLTSEDRFQLMIDYQQNGVPERATIGSLLEEYNIKYDDLTEFILNFNVGRCNYANRTKDQIYISRHNSPIKDNIIINLTDSKDVPDLTIQTQINENFIHEEAYTQDGLEIYRI